MENNNLLNYRNINESNDGCKVVGVVNQKGGVAKTSTAIILAYELANKYKKKVCLIDFDGQANASISFGIKEYLNSNINEESEQPVMLNDFKETIFELICEIIDTDEVPKKDKYIKNLKGVDVIPANQELNKLEKCFSRMEMDVENTLKRFIESIRADYDYIIIDSLPKLGIQMINVLVACDEIIIPTNPSMYSISGFSELLVSIKKVKRILNPKLKVAGVLITMACEGTSACSFLTEEINKVFSEYRVFKSIIPFVKKWDECYIFGNIFTEHNPNHKATKRYFEFIEEYLTGN